MCKLGINIDHVATLRNARGQNHPDPLKAAMILKECKVDSITMHLREDRRHIKDDDIYLIKDYYKFMGKSSEHLYPKFIDTNAIAKGIKMGLPYKAGDDLLEYQYKAYHTIKKGVKTNLTALGKEFEIDVDYNNLHDAVNDLILNIKVWDKLKWQIEI